MKKQQKEKPPSEEAQTRLALRAAQKEIERLKKLIDKRVREISELRKCAPPEKVWERKPPAKCVHLRTRPRH